MELSEAGDNIRSSASVISEPSQRAKERVYKCLCVTSLSSEARSQSMSEGHHFAGIYQPIHAFFGQSEKGKFVFNGVN